MSHSPTKRSGGELEEIRARLRDAPHTGDAAARRRAMRDVVALMTSGLDTSALFPEVVMCCFTSDLVCKKMVYLYLTTQSKGKEDLAVLAINALVKECHDANPVVRGLALRSLSALHVSNLLEYLIPLIEKSVADSSAYVRRAAACCLLRLFHRSPREFHEHKGFEHALHLLSDPDVHVSSNALEVLLEVTHSEAAPAPTPQYAGHPPFTVSRALLYRLLNRLRVVSEWQQIQMLHLCLQYTPASEEEMYEMMNLLDDRLESNNSGVVMACSRVFLHLTQNAPAVQRKVYERLRSPLLMIASMSGATETAFAALCHVKVLARQNARLFAADFKSFYCDEREPSCNKCVKMDILAAIVSADSAPSIIEELVAYSEDRRAAVARAAIATLGRVAVTLPATLGAVLVHLTDFITLGLEDVRGATLTVLTDVLRQHTQPDVVRPVVQTVVDCFKETPFADEESRLALVWLLGEFGESIADAPYLLEIFLDALPNESAALRLQLLTSAATLFFKRPAETQRCLGGTLHALLKDFTNADVLDKALLYYRLLHTDTAAAARVIGATKTPVRAFAEDVDAGVLDRLMAEFDTLSIVFGVPQDKFTTGPPQWKAESGTGTEEEEEEEEEEEDVGNHRDEVDTPPPPLHAVTSAASTAPRAGIEHLFGGAASPSPLRLSAEAELEPDEFQSKWTAARHTAAFTVELESLTRASPSAAVMEAVEAALESHSIFVLASGVQDGAQKLFLYAEATAPVQAWLLVEVLVFSTGTVRVTVKSVETAELHDFEDEVRAALYSVK